MRPGYNADVVVEGEDEHDVLFYGMPLVGVAMGERTHILNELERSLGATALRGQAAETAFDVITDMASLNSRAVKASTPTRFRYALFSFVSPDTMRHFLAISDTAASMLQEYILHPLANQVDPGRMANLQAFVPKITERKTYSRYPYSLIR